MSGHCLYQLGVITYFQLNRDYIARVLCINKKRDEPITMCGGSCFLERNLKIADDVEQSSMPPLSTTKIEVPVFVISQYLFSTEQSYTMPIRHFTPYDSILSSGVSSLIFHPPSVV